ncbi:MAG: GTPase Era [Gammaproteobacteria bacterium]|nr:GTPase Era [Gammaproteobacteria bacterium]
MTDFHCGYIALIGRPNVGKSTLFNAMLGQKISITAPRPQTTRHQVLGIKTSENAQFIFVDTPGLQKEPGKKSINRYMNRAARSVIQDVDVVLFLIESHKLNGEDLHLIDIFKQQSVTPIVVINKLDLKKNKNELLPLIEKLHVQLPESEIIPLSALKKDNIETLEKSIKAALPIADPVFPGDQITDRSMRFFAAEIIREKLFRMLQQELPYSLTVDVSTYEESEKIVKIQANIWVERNSQKGIVIGKSGQQLKEVGKRARADIENMIDKKVYLELWVKVKENWGDDEAALNKFGYGDV